MKAILFPLEKVILDGKEIRLGMHKSEVEALLGTTEDEDENRFYYYDEVAIDYAPDDTVEFIEFLGGPDGFVQPEIYGVMAFQADADALEQLLAEHNGADIDRSEEDSVAYRTIGVGIYRENEQDRWETIGIGGKDYYE